MPSKCPKCGSKKVFVPGNVYVVTQEELKTPAAILHIRQRLGSGSAAAPD
jgi:hypothetical protein